MKTGAIDIGNSYVKWGIFEGNKLLRDGREESVENIPLAMAEKWISSTVRKKGETENSEILFLDENTLLPIKNLYRTPATLGKDRLAAVCGAAALFPGDACLAIDAGTCITFDYINENKEYLGGSISPGLKMRLQALNRFTDMLPLTEKRDFFDMTGSNTEECILSGAIQGIIGEIRHRVTFYRGISSSLKVLITGGDASFFENKLNLNIFAAPQLVLSGLNEILKHNLHNA